MTISGRTKSFHDEMNCITPTVPRIGPASGRTTLRSCWKWLAPSISAASKRSCGVSWMKFRSTKMPKIWPPDAPTMISAESVLSRFMSRRSVNSGTRFAIAGIIMRSRSAFQRNAWPGAFRRAKKYAPHSASPSVISVQLVEMNRLLATVGVTMSHAVRQFSQNIGCVSFAGAR